MAVEPEEAQELVEQAVAAVLEQVELHLRQDQVRVRADKLQVHQTLEVVAVEKELVVQVLVVVVDQV